MTTLLWSGMRRMFRRADDALDFASAQRKRGRTVEIRYKNETQLYVVVVTVKSSTN